MSEGYILNTLQTPAFLHPVYESIRSGNRTREEIETHTGLETDPVQQATDALRYCRLLGKEDGEYTEVAPKWELPNQSLAFRMSILHSLAQECRPGDWGKQAAVLLNYQYLLQEDIQYFENDDQAVYDAINEWHRTEKNYTPMSQQGEIDLNKPKFVNWSRFVDYLGLVHKARGREHTVYPDPEIISTAISLAITERGEKRRIEIETFLDWLQENLLAVSLTSDGNVPASLSRVLYNLVRDGDISLVEYGDAGAVSLARTPTHDGIDADANTLEVHTK
jgi:hypothetical protein